jgi:hypothetical protein
MAKFLIKTLYYYETLPEKSEQAVIVASTNTKSVSHKELANNEYFTFGFGLHNNY